VGQLAFVAGIAVLVVAGALFLLLTRSDGKDPRFGPDAAPRIGHHGHLPSQLSFPFGAPLRRRSRQGGPGSGGGPDRMVGRVACFPDVRDHRRTGGFVTSGVV